MSPRSTPPLRSHPSLDDPSSNKCHVQPSCDLRRARGDVQGNRIGSSFCRLTSTCPPELAVEPVSKAGVRQPRSKTKGEGHINIKQLVVTESGHEPIRASRHRYDDQEHTL